MVKSIQLKKVCAKKSALRAAGRDWSVLPVRGTRAGKCTCGNSDCDNPGKHPLTRHGVTDATTDEGTIRRWWKKYPEANVGIATGKSSGLVVLDIDEKHGGFVSLKKLETMIGPLPDGPKVRTGGGGLHLYFRYPGGTVKSRTGILQGIDVRADGAYVVGPGSRHKSGKPYLWLHNRSPKKIALPSLPDELLRLIEGQSVAHAQSELKIPEGQRNSTLTSLAGSMRIRGMTQPAIEAALIEDNQLRCNPPLREAEVIGIARSISRYAPGDTGILSASSIEEVQAERKKLIFRTGKQIENETPASIPWVVPPFVAFGAITEIDGKVKLGKSTLVTHLVRAVLDGLPFLKQPTNKTKVVYLTEQPIVSFRPAMERADLLGRKDFTVLLWSDTMGTPWSAVIEAAVQQCKRIGAKLLVIDTLAQFAGLLGDRENNAGDALQAMRPLQEAAKEGIAVVIVRHERKSGGAVGDSGRGSSAFAAVVDVIISVRQPKGNHPRNVRLLEPMSRFGNPDDMLIVLTDEGYRSLGAPGDAAKAQAAAELLSAIPKSKKKAATIEELAKATGKSRAKLQQLLDSLEEADEILKSGEGRKGSPYRYYKP